MNRGNKEYLQDLLEQHRKLLTEVLDRYLACFLLPFTLVRHQIRQSEAPLPK